MEKAIVQYGCRVLFVDNLMTAITDDIASDLYRQQTKFVKALAFMAKKYNVLIFNCTSKGSQRGMNSEMMM